MWIYVEYVCSLSLSFSDHHFCENAELRASFHHVKMHFSSPCPYFCACICWDVHTCALLYSALSHELFCLWMCLGSNSHRHCSLPHLCRPTQRLFISPLKWKGSLLQRNIDSYVDRDLNQGTRGNLLKDHGLSLQGPLAGFPEYQMVSIGISKNNNSACSLNKWYFWRQCLMRIAPICAGAGYTL